MVYKNSGNQPRERAMLAAYALHQDFKAKQTDIAKVLGCSQSTVANWCKEMKLRNQIENLKTERDQAHDYIETLHNEIKLIEHHQD